MSELPPDPAELLSYQAVMPDEKPKFLVRLAVIFNFIMAGLDGLYGLVLLGFSVAMPVILAHDAARRGGGGPPPPPAWLFVLMYGGMGLAGIGVGIVKTIAGFKMLRRRPRAWGWGLAAGIVGCTQLWCSLFCILPLSAAIYTIVILCREDVRTYLLSPSEQDQATP